MTGIKVSELLQFFGIATGTNLCGFAIGVGNSTTQVHAPQHR